MWGILTIYDTWVRSTFMVNLHKNNIRDDVLKLQVIYNVDLQVTWENF